MKSTTSLFTSKIISSERYRRLKKYRYALYWLLFLLIGIVQRVCPRGESCTSLLEMLNIDLGFFAVVFAITLISTIILYFYSKEIEISGEISINKRGFTLDKDGVLVTYSFKEVVDMLIERKATYHYEYKEKNYLKETDNWLCFAYKNEQQKIEFIIDAERKNEEFEKMIATLRVNRVKFKYLSV